VTQGAARSCKAGPRHGGLRRQKPAGPNDRRHHEDEDEPVQRRCPQGINLARLGAFADSTSQRTGGNGCAAAGANAVGRGLPSRCHGHRRRLPWLRGHCGQRLVACLRHAADALNSQGKSPGNGKQAHKSRGDLGHVGPPDERGWRSSSGAHGTVGTDQAIGPGGPLAGGVTVRPRWLRPTDCFGLGGCAHSSGTDARAAWAPSSGTPSLPSP
jgi:hypothetical protein